MGTAIIRHFLNFFQEYIDLCRLEDWPDNDTSEAELRNAFVISRHIESCVYGMQRRNVANDFLSLLNSYDFSNIFLRDALRDPPKCILKKVINSNTNINKMDVGFKVFLEIFSEDKLENCLTKLMLEAASKDTLLKNIKNNITNDKIHEFKSKVLLSDLRENPSDIWLLIHKCKQETVELFVVSLLNKEPKYNTAVKSIANGVLNIVSSKDSKYKNFWRYLFEVEEKYVIEMCMENPDIFMYIVQALADCGKLVREGMSAESFYIDLTQSELATAVQCLCRNESLKSQFFNTIKDYDSMVSFWENML